MIYKSNNFCNMSSFTAGTATCISHAIKHHNYLKKRNLNFTEEVLSYNSNGNGYVDANGNGVIKGNASSKIYHLPCGAYYDRTKAEVWFKTESEAQAAEYRRSSR